VACLARSSLEAPDIDGSRRKLETLSLTMHLVRALSVYLDGAHLRWDLLKSPLETRDGSVDIRPLWNTIRFFKDLASEIIRRRTNP
jgi:hypothetical protein